MPAALQPILAWAGVLTIVWLLFKELGDSVRPEVRESAARWLTNMKVGEGGDTERWQGTFIALFDKLFGIRHPSGLPHFS